MVIKYHAPHRPTRSPHRTQPNSLAGYGSTVVKGHRSHLKSAIHDDPYEMTNRFDDPGCRPIVEALMTRAYRIISDTDDHPLGNATYRVLTLAPCGPEIPSRT